MIMKLNYRYRIIICILLLTGSWQSCKKETGAPEDKPITSFNDVFEQFWDKMNERYVFWNEDKTDWDAKYKQYKPLFEALDLNKKADLQKSVQYFREMTADIMDGHFYITFTHALLSDSSIYPSLARKKRSPYYHGPVTYSVVVRNHLDPGYQSGSDGKTVAVSGTINNNILYFSCSNFFLYDACNSTGNNNVKNVLRYFFNMLEEPAAPYKGIILDVRGNGGGDISDLNFLMGRFTTYNLPFGATRYKTGTGRLDYSPWIESHITPVKDSKGVNAPVIVLADNFSASLAESVTMVVKQLPNGKFIGEPTWGANGPYASNELLYNAGPFELKNFMKVQTSSAAFKNINGEFTEAVGITPDLFVPFDQEAYQRGRDLILEAAIGQLK